MARRPIRILAAEDDADTRDILAYVLVQEGYLVVTAPDGERALELMRSTRPDVVLLDLLMPRLGGDAVARAMAGDPALAEIPIISLSASPPRPGPARVAAAIQKPFSLAELVETIERVLEARGGRGAPGG